MEPYEGTYSEMLVNDPFQIPDQPEDMPEQTRVVHAFELRKAGADWDDIADKLGYASGESCRVAVTRRIQRYFEAQPKEIAEIVGLELARLDELQLVAWRIAVRDEDLGAIDRILKIMERRAKLLGLDKAPDSTGSTTTNQTAVFIGGKPEDFLEGIKQAQKVMEAGSE